MEPQRSPARSLRAATAAWQRLCRPGGRGAHGPRTQAGQATARGQGSRPPPRLCLAANPPTGEPAAGPSLQRPSSDHRRRKDARRTQGPAGRLPPSHRTSEIPIATSAKELPTSHEVNSYTNRETKTNRQKVSTHLCVCGRAGGGVEWRESFQQNATEILLYQRTLHQRCAWKLGAHAEGPTAQRPLRSECQC